jgi:hypothetical protein
MSRWIFLKIFISPQILQSYDHALIVILGLLEIIWLILKAGASTLQRLSRQRDHTYRPISKTLVHNNSAFSRAVIDVI